MCETVPDDTDEADPPRCPVCDAMTQGPVESFTTEQAAAHFCSPTRNRDRYERLVECIGELWPKGTCEIYRCPSCGFGFGSPFVGGDEQFYSILHEQMGYPDWRWDYDVAHPILESVEPGPILDVGAGDGQFLSSLGKEWDPNAVEASQATRAELEARGITTYDSLADINSPNSLRAVTIFQTLEHIAEYEETLGYCQELLEQGGVIIITVPDAESMFKQEKVVGWPDMPPNHINKWSPESLRRVLEEEGFEVFRVEHEEKSIDNVKSKVHMRLRREARRTRSIASQVYKISSRPLRAVGLAALAPFALLRMIHELPYLLRGGAFCMAARRK